MINGNCKHQAAREALGYKEVTTSQNKNPKCWSKEVTTLVQNKNKRIKGGCLERNRERQL